MTVGVRLLLVRGNDVLLVRHTYLPGWYLPGGGVGRGETIEEAARREAAEELGAELGELSLLGVYANRREGKTDHVVVLVCRAFALGEMRDGEIAEARFFSLQALPGDASPGTRRRLVEYTEGGGPRLAVW